MRAWGVTPITPPPPPPQPPTIRLSDSFSVVMTLFHCIIEARVRIGDKFISSMVKARDGSQVNVMATAENVPTPRCELEVSPDEYFRSQGYYALNAAIKTSFCDGTIPRVSLRCYMERFFNSPPLQAISPSVYLLMLIYLDRASASCPGFFLNSLNVHRMILGAFVVAAKYHEDEYVLQSQFAKHGGVTARELCDIERTFLKAMRYRCFVSKELFEMLEIDIMKEALQSSDFESVLDILRNEHIVGVDQAWASVNTNCDGSASGNYMVARAGCGGGGSVDQVGTKAQDMAVKIRAHSRALISCMFPGMPVDPTEEDAWTIRCGVGRMTAEQYQVYRSLLCIVVGLESEVGAIANMPTAWIQAFLPDYCLEKYKVMMLMGNSNANRRGITGMEVDEHHSTNIAKSAVSFLLNDNDPFEDLKLYPSGVVYTAAQQCGGKSLLMQW